MLAAHLTISSIAVKSRKRQASSTCHRSSRMAERPVMSLKQIANTVHSRDHGRQSVLSKRHTTRAILYPSAPGINRCRNKQKRRRPSSRFASVVHPISETETTPLRRLRPSTTMPSIAIDEKTRKLEKRYITYITSA